MTFYSSNLLNWTKWTKNWTTQIKLCQNLFKLAENSVTVSKTRHIHNQFTQSLRHLFSEWSNSMVLGSTETGRIRTMPLCVPTVKAQILEVVLFSHWIFVHHLMGKLTNRTNIKKNSQILNHFFVICKPYQMHNNSFKAMPITLPLSIICTKTKPHNNYRFYSKCLVRKDITQLQAFQELDITIMPFFSVRHPRGQ